jgi:hypothetical protein
MIHPMLSFHNAHFPISHHIVDIDASSRLSIYQVPPMDNALHTALMPMALTREALVDSLVLIVLDWEKPWTFLRDLRTWFQALIKVISDIENDANAFSQDNRRRKGKYVVEEGRELRKSQAAISCKTCLY